MEDTSLYWEGKGKYQHLYDTISEKHVPIRGSADDPDVDIVRIIANFIYEIYNNGGINLFDWNRPRLAEKWDEGLYELGARTNVYGPKYTTAYLNVRSGIERALADVAKVDDVDVAYDELQFLGPDLDKMMDAVLSYIEMNKPELLT